MHATALPSAGRLGTVRWVSILERLIASGPDPEGGGPRLERFVEMGGRVPADSEGQALLAAVLSSGSFLSGILLSDAERLPTLLADPYLRRLKPREVVVRQIAAAARGAASFGDLQQRLRIERQREMLRLGARELGLGTTLEVASELSGLADACLEAAVVFCDAELRSAFGAPTSPGAAPSFVVMGMGKLGGEELNFSSDVDLVYVYSTDEGAAGTLTLHEYYARLSQQVTRALGEITNQGLVFRVDLRLRPEGASGPICNSLAAAESYYETFGRTWERQALLRARPSAGDRALGERLLRTLEPFVFPRAAGPRMLDETRALRRLARESGDGPSFNVKLGAGGIRDVELVAQVLQLLYAGKRRELRERGTLAALRKLCTAGLLSDHEARALGAAYRFLRTIEHRLQLDHGAQTHDLPADDPGLERLARGLGFVDRSALLVAIESHRTAVTRVSESLGEPEEAPPALVMRLLDPAGPRERLEADLGTAGLRDIHAAADALGPVRGRMPPEWLCEALASPDPDRALGHFRDLALRASMGIFALLRQEPTFLRMLAGLFGTSERLSRHLLAHPAMWEPLAEGLGEPSPEPAYFARMLRSRLQGTPSPDLETALREMLRFSAEEILRIGVHDVAGNLLAEQVSAQLSALAEACLAETMSAVADALAERFGRPQTAMTVLALGSLGAREMRYGSDMDLVFLYARPGTTARGMDHSEWFARLSQRLIGALGARLDEGRLYEVDTRLRPSGAQGMLVTTYDAFDDYHRAHAAPWERVALLRARPVFSWPPVPGDPVIDFAPWLEEIVYRPVDEEMLRGDLIRMRARIEAERGPHQKEAVHLRFSPGGLTDLEFLAAWGQLRTGRHDAALRTPAPILALGHLLPRPMLDDYRFLASASLRLRLLREGAEDLLLPEDRPALARSLGLEESRLTGQLAESMARVRETFTATLVERR